MEGLENRFRNQILMKIQWDPTHQIILFLSSFSVDTALQHCIQCKTVYVFKIYKGLMMAFMPKHVA
jgi:uncharacterized membrane protein